VRRPRIVTAARPRIITAARRRTAMLRRAAVTMQHQITKTGDAKSGSPVLNVNHIRGAA